jgi:hypothetical protein
MSLPSVPVVPQEARRESRIISNTELLKCLGDRAAYYDLYNKLTNRAIEAYVKAGRRKFALRLHGSLAALDVLVGTFSFSTPSHGYHLQPPRPIEVWPSNIFLAASPLFSTQVDIVGILCAFQRY